MSTIGQGMPDGPECGLCGCLLLPKNATLHPEYFLCDACFRSVRAVPGANPIDENLRKFRWWCPQCRRADSFAAPTGLLVALGVSEHEIEELLPTAARDEHAREFLRDREDGEPVCAGKALEVAEVFQGNEIAGGVGDSRGHRADLEGCPPPHAGFGTPPAPLQP